MYNAIHPTHLVSVADKSWQHVLDCPLDQDSAHHSEAFPDNQSELSIVSVSQSETSITLTRVRSLLMVCWS